MNVGCNFTRNIFYNLSDTVDGDLPRLVYFSKGFKILEARHPFKVGGSKAFTVTGRVLREGVKLVSALPLSLSENTFLPARFIFRAKTQVQVHRVGASIKEFWPEPDCCIQLSSHNKLFFRQDIRRSVERCGVEDGYDTMSILSLAQHLQQTRRRCCINI